MRDMAVESHPFGFARGFGKTGQALFAKCAKRMGHPRQERVDRTLLRANHGLTDSRPSRVRRPGGNARRSPKLRLEAEACLNFNYATRQAVCGRAEQALCSWGR
jgi:hypothetical protein